MATVFTTRSSDYNGSGSPSTAAGPINVTFSGTNGESPIGCVCMSRSDTAAFAKTSVIPFGERKRINLASGDEYYFVASIPADASADLAVVDA